MVSFKRGFTAAPRSCQSTRFMRISGMSTRSELLKRMAIAYALGDVAIPYNHEQRNNPLTADLDAPARHLAELLRYAATHPDDPMSDKIRRSHDLIAKVLAVGHLPKEMP